MAFWPKRFFVVSAFWQKFDVICRSFTRFFLPKFRFNKMVIWSMYNLTGRVFWPLGLVVVHFTENPFTEKIWPIALTLFLSPPTETTFAWMPFDQTPFYQKFIWPKALYDNRCSVKWFFTQMLLRSTGFRQNGVLPIEFSVEINRKRSNFFGKMYRSPTF
jgi:hypothetical protein